MPMCRLIYTAANVLFICQCANRYTQHQKITAAKKETGQVPEIAKEQQSKLDAEEKVREDLDRFERELSMTAAVAQGSVAQEPKKKKRHKQKNKSKGGKKKGKDSSEEDTSTEKKKKKAKKNKG